MLLLNPEALHKFVEERNLFKQLSAPFLDAV